jgi:hypothetical protein
MFEGGRNFALMLFTIDISQRIGYKLSIRNASVEATNRMVQIG